MAAQPAFDDLISLHLQQPITIASPTLLNPDGSQKAKPAFSTSSQDKNEALASSLSAAVDQERNYDLYSILFSPSTPHASPNYSSDQLPLEEQKSRKAAPPPLHQRSASMSSKASDFGSFVSVSNVDDPLSTDFEDFEDNLQEPLTATPTYANINEQSKAGSDSDLRQKELTRPTSRVSSSSRSASRSLQSEEISSPSLSFFDQFAKDAKQRSDERSSVLNELLLHEDDPLYFLNTPSSPPPPSVPPKSPVAALNADLFSSPEPLQTSQSAATVKPVSPPPTRTLPNDPVADLNRDFNFAHDVDHNFFRVPSTTPPAASALRPSPYSPPHPETSTFILGDRPIAPPRSCSISVADPQLAAPITSVRSVVGSPSAPAALPSSISFTSDSDGYDEADSPHDSDDTPTADSEQNPQLHRAQSFSSLSGSLSSLPGKWMPTFLRGTGGGTTQPTHTAQGGGARPALESLFRDPHAAPEPHHAQTLPTSVSASAATSTGPAQRHTQPTFSHTSAFSASPPPGGLPSTMYSSGLAHSSSPFAPHVYVPPSGAPGYAGEGYSGRMWDKGFSEELEREMRNGAGRGNVQGPQVGRGAPGAANTGAVYKEAQDTGAGAVGRGRWGSGFGFGFRSIRGRNATSNEEVTADLRTGVLAGHNGKPGWQNSAPGNMEVGDGGMGAFIEQKTGKVELRGRKEMTTPVLSPELATKVSPTSSEL